MVSIKTLKQEQKIASNLSTIGIQKMIITNS